MHERIEMLLKKKGEKKAEEEEEEGNECMPLHELDNIS